MEDRTTISSSRSPRADVARATFSPVPARATTRGRSAAYLEQVARELASAERRIAELREHVADAERRALHPVLDEATLASALGSRSAALLQERPRGGPAGRHRGAGRAASELLGEAQDRAASVIVEAQQHAAATVAEAEHAAAALETEARTIAERLVDTARSNGDALVERAREQGRTIVEESQETRRKILADLLVRRKTLHVQIEQLRAARDSLTASVHGLRTTVDTTLGELEGSDERAKKAAIELLRSKPTPPPMGEEALERPGAEHPSGGSPPPGAPRTPTPSRRSSPSSARPPSRSAVPRRRSRGSDADGRAARHPGERDPPAPRRGGRRTHVTRWCER